MARSNNGAPGEEPAAAPVVPESTAQEAGADAPAGDTQPKRRRGNRGGRRHKKPATEAAVAQQPAELPDQPAVQSSGSSPRDGYSSGSGGLSDLPTAPLIPVGPVVATERGGRAAAAAPEAAAPAPAQPRKRSRSRRPVAGLALGCGHRLFVLAKHHTSSTNDSAITSICSGVSSGQ